MHHDVEVVPDADTAASTAATWLADRVLTSVADRGSFTLAVSGGRTPWAMLALLTTHALPWDAVTVFQVDERVARAGDDARNLTHLRASLRGVHPRIRPMPVERPDLDAAAASYAAELPDRFDVVHLGLGADGHTASLVPGDAVLDVSDHLVAATATYDGHRRMTLTLPALARADQLLWLVTGTEKRVALKKLLSGDQSIPAGRVGARASLVLTDQAIDEARDAEGPKDARTP